MESADGSARFAGATSQTNKLPDSDFLLSFSVLPVYNISAPVCVRQHSEPWRDYDGKQHRSASLLQSLSKAEVQVKRQPSIQTHQELGQRDGEQQ